MASMLQPSIFLEEALSQRTGQTAASMQSSDRCLDGEVGRSMRVAELRSILLVGHKDMDLIEGV